MNVISKGLWGLYLFTTIFHLYVVQKADLLWINRSIAVAMPILMLMIYLETKCATRLSK